MKITHVVPLSPLAYEILKRQQARAIDSLLVFVHGPALTGSDYHVGEPLTDSCVRRHLRKATGDPFITIHSFRRNFGSWAKQHGCSLELRRTILGHAVGNKSDRTYEGDAEEIEGCREGLDKWAEYLAGPPKHRGRQQTEAAPRSKSANVISITKGRTVNA